VLAGGPAQRAYQKIADVSIEPDRAQAGRVLEFERFESGNDFGRPQIGIEYFDSGEIELTFVRWHGR
jgi:hypothetical protein